MARQVAHEIKNPLTPIRLGVQHLRRAYGDSRPDFGDILDTNVERILAEIDRLDEIARNFSRYGTAPAERQPPGMVDVSAVARDVVGLERLGGGERQGSGFRVQGAAGKAGSRKHDSPLGGGPGAGDGTANEVAWRLVGVEEPIRAVARADELREVLLNLLENSRLAGATNVELRCARRDGRVVIEVSDDGSGVPAHVLPRLFEPHFSTRSSGSGLGLAMSRQLVESWGGAIAIASTEGEGTRVRIELSASDGETGEVST
jgi:Signal transduction histidine kinase involved in nitrogen fixation and metabolism regulation